MRLSVLLLLCTIILCAFGVIRSPLLRIGISSFRVAILALLLMIANNYYVSLTSEIGFNPASILLLVAGGFVYLGGELKILPAFIFSIVAGILMAWLNRLINAGSISVSEPGLLLALCAMPFAFFFAPDGPELLAVPVLAPVIMAIANMGLEFLAYGYGVLNIGEPIAFDTQVAGVVLCAAVGMVRAKVKGRKRERANA